MEKTFEALYATAMAMADACIVNKQPFHRFKKLDEECTELIEAFNELGHFERQEEEFVNGRDHKEYLDRLKGELSDVLFVLLHIGHQHGITAFDMLHMASSKMLARMNDDNYKAKN
jgi:NTP pyrophosphatase (non-canonical NTP hydrolase)